MRDRFKKKARTCFVIGGLLLLMGITSVGHVQAAGLTATEEYWLMYMREGEKLARPVLPSNSSVDVNESDPAAIVTDVLAAFWF